MEKQDLTREEEHQVCEALVCAGLSVDDVRLIIDSPELAGRVSQTVCNAIRKKMAEKVAKEKSERSGGTSSTSDDFGSHFW